MKPTDNRPNTLLCVSRTTTILALLAASCRPEMPLIGRTDRRLRGANMADGGIPRLHGPHAWLNVMRDGTRARECMTFSPPCQSPLGADFMGAIAPQPKTCGGGDAIIFISFPSPTLSFIPDLNLPFLQILPTAAHLFLLQDNFRLSTAR